MEATSSSFTGIKSIHGFYKMHDRVKSRLTSVSIDTRTNQTYASYCYDKLTNLSLGHKDTCIVLNRGLTVHTESANGIRVICNIGSSLFESMYRKKMVSNLCAPQKYHKIDILLHLLAVRQSILD